ncbi:MAG TPA: DUF952 domain-containing protein [Candidatus Sericytochromatia bacterium]|jgi:uncharacterized protein (DUF952 family)
MNKIWHITKRQQWEQAKLAQVYRSETLESEGFIHCSTPQQVLKVANAFFRGQQGLVLLGIDSGKVQAEIRYEEVDGKEYFPHIYGALNTEAVIEVLDFEPRDNGQFKLPKPLAEMT